MSSKENVGNGEACCTSAVSNSISTPKKSVDVLINQEKDGLSAHTKLKSESTENGGSETSGKPTEEQTATSHPQVPSVPSKCQNKKEFDGDISIEFLGPSSQDIGGNGEDGLVRFIGIILAMAAALMFSMSALIIKVLGYHPLNLGVWRFGVMAIIPFPLLWHAAIWGKGNTFLEEIWPERSYKSGILLIIQAVLGANSILLTFNGLKYLNIADCIVIGTSAPVFVTFFAFIFLGEKCGVFPVVTALLALGGVTIISKPPILTGEESLDDETMIGVGSSFSSMILLTMCYIIVRSLRNVHHALVNLCFGLWGFFQSLIIATLMNKLEVPQSYHEISLITVSALLAFCAQTCLTLALKYEQAGPVALVRTTEVIFAFVWQAIFLGVKPDLYSVIGAIVTLFGVVLTSFRKMIMSLPEDDEHRRRFRFLLL